MSNWVVGILATGFALLIVELQLNEQAQMIRELRRDVEELWALHHKKAKGKKSR